MLATLALGLSILTAPPFTFDSYGPNDPAVPKPAEILGYEIGHQHTVYHDQDRVTKAIAQAAPTRVKTIEYGKSTEGRTLRVFAISSPANIARLEEIRSENERLAHPEMGAKPKDNPAIIWINECIHGDETASFESGMELIYTLAASQDPKVKEALDKAVVIVNPVYNPDGHERYVVAYNSIPNGNPERGGYDSAIPSAFYGRYNHYRFDMNRDRIAMSQAETQQEVALFLQWNPQVYVDQHGQVETYFMPPVQQSVNVNVGRERYETWTNILGRAAASAFDAQGWTYFIRDSFDLYNACYLDSHTTLMGAIGMTNETDGGRVMVTEREDGTFLRLRDGIAKHFTSAMAYIQTTAANKDELLKSYSDFKKDAVSGKHAGKFQRVILESQDPRELRRLQAHLGRSGIHSYFASEDWMQSKSHDYWSDQNGERKFKEGSLVVDMAQNQGPLAKALLEANSDFEPDFIARQKALSKAQKDETHDTEIDDFEFYDSTAWSLPYAYNLKAWWCEDRPTVRQDKVGSPKENPVTPTVGFALRYTDQNDIRFAANQLLKDTKVSMSRKTLKVGGQTFAPGTFFFLSARNEDGFEAALTSAADAAGVQLVGINTSYPDQGRQGPGSESMIQLRKPKIGVVFGNAGNLSGGALWYLMEKEFRLPFFGLSMNSLNGDLDRYTTIVIPGGVDVTSNANLLAWMRSGGNVVMLEAGGWAFSDKGFQKLDSVDADTSLPGAQFRAELDRTSLLACGYPAPEKGPIPIAVPIDGQSFFKTPKSGSDVVLSGDKAVKKLLSGWSWDDTEKDLTGVTWAHVASYGRGRAILFTSDPTYRAQWPGLNKMVLNSMLIGPSW